MSSFDDATQRIRRPAADTPPETPLPGPLDLTAADPVGQNRVGQNPVGQNPVGQDGVGWPDPDHPDPLAQPQDPTATATMRLDEIFDRAQPAPQTAPEPPPAPVPAAPTMAAPGADAPTWTAMPVVSVSSDPAGAHPAPRRGSAAITPRVRPGTGAAGAAVAGAWRQVEGWLRQQDNALSALTGLVAIVLIIVVAVLGH